MEQLGQHLADISAGTIMWIACVLTAARILFMRIRSRRARSVSEITEAVLIAIVLMFMLVLPFGVQSFFIPSGSMRPGLIDNDRIMVNKFIYRFSSPVRQDCIVFVPPQRAINCEGDAHNNEQEYYIKRLIGRPGDKVEVRRGIVKIGSKGNEKIYSHSDIRRIFSLFDQNKVFLKFTTEKIEVLGDPRIQEISKSDIAWKAALPGQRVVIVPGQVLVNGEVLSEPYAAEDPDYDLKIYNGKSMRRDLLGYHLNCSDCTLQQIPKFDSFVSERIPKNQFFVLGDNRNYSNDSSQWGLFSSDRVVGKAELIYFPFSRFRSVKK